MTKLLAHTLFGACLLAGCGDLGAEDASPTTRADAGRDGGRSDASADARPPDRDGAALDSGVPMQQPSPVAVDPFDAEDCLGTCCLAPAETLPTSIDFATCESAETCLAVFGTPAPRIVEGFLEPGGSATDDAGGVLGDPISLDSHSVDIAATLRLPQSCASGCIDGAGIGFTANFDVSDPIVDPRVAVIIDGSAREASLVVAGRTVGRIVGLESGDRLHFTVEPSGRTTVSVDGRATIEALFAPFDRASLLFFGRNENRSADDPYATSFGNVEIVTRVCDVPTAWSQAERVAIEATSLEGPSVARSGAETWLAYSDGEDIHILTRDSDELPFMEKDRIEGPIPSFAMGAKRHPAFVESLDGGFDLYFAAEDQLGEQVIARAVGNPAEGYVVDEAPVLAPTIEGVDFDQPALTRFQNTMFAGLVMVLRETAPNGTSSLHVYTQREGAEFEELDSILPALTRSGGEAPIFGVFSELRSPTVVVEAGHWTLYFAGRRGARWTIGALTSPDLATFWGSDSPTILDGSDSFDRLAVFDPEVRVQDGQAVLHYVGSNGLEDALVRATRPVPR